MNEPPGQRRWVIAEGYLPGAGSDTDSDPRFVSHETACIVNCGAEDADVAITIYFSDREPLGPYRLSVPARRTRHVRFDELSEPASIPRETDYASLIESTAPVVVQHTRLDARRAELALLTTIAYPAG